MEEITKIWIESAKKHISIDEFKSYLPKQGDCYKTNDAMVWICNGEGGPIPFRQFCCQSQKEDDEMIYYNMSYTDHMEPQLDFVNKVLKKEYKKLNKESVIAFLSLVRDFKQQTEFTKSIINQL